MKFSKLFAVTILVAYTLLLAAFKDNKPAKMTFNYLEQLVLKLSNYNNTLPEDKVYLQTDKPMYNPGETIWVNAFVRDGATLKPSKKSGVVHVELRNPKGAIVKTHSLIAKDGSAPADFEIDENWSGGIYKVKAWTEWQKKRRTTCLLRKRNTGSKKHLAKTQDEARLPKRSVWHEGQRQGRTFLKYKQQPTT